MNLLLDTHALIWFLDNDRLLIAQAQTEGMTLVSSDPHFPEYNVPLLW